MYQPQFPYLGNQVIITSGRVTHHSYDDFIFLFGKKGVAISSPATFTVDANEKTTIASPKIELGFNALRIGEPVLLGTSTVIQLGFLLDSLINLSKELQKMKAEQLELSVPGIVNTSKVLEGIASRVKAQLNSACLSKNTFTR
jgi:hypothetical protein